MLYILELSNKFDLNQTTRVLHTLLMEKSNYTKYFLEAYYENHQILEN